MILYNGCKIMGMAKTSTYTGTDDFDLLTVPLAPEGNIAGTESQVTKISLDG